MAEIRYKFRKVSIQNDGSNLNKGRENRADLRNV